MKLLKDILYKVSLISTKGDMEITVNNLVFDSRQVMAGDLFIAMRGTQVDGHEFIDTALEKGASCIVCEVLPHSLRDTITYVQVVDAAKSLGMMAANFYNHPSTRLTLVAVTGTNGKTTMVTLLHQLFSELGYQAGLL